MIEYTKYNPITGQIVATGTAQDECLHLYEPYVAQRCNFETQYIDVVSKLPVDKKAKPSKFHEFDYEVKDWVLNEEKLISTNRDKRNELLLQSDWTQLQDVDLTELEKNNWAIYRKSLRDMTTEDFLNDNFPSKPY